MGRIVLEAARWRCPTCCPVVVPTEVASASSLGVQDVFETPRHLWTRPEILVLDESSVRPRYVAQQWTVALNPAVYQAVHDQ
jgi:hypothetical protein